MKRILQIIFLSISIIIISSCDSYSVLSEKENYQNNQITGNVFQHTFYSKILNNNREIFVWVPDDYHLYNREYPLLIIHDGQNVFHAGGSMSGDEWQLDEIVTEMINTNEIEPIIMVGVANTKDRSLEYNPIKNGKNYGEALSKELLPELKKEYNISNGRIGTIGASMGGLISLYLGWEMNSIFSMAACLSPAFVYNDFDYISIIEKSEVPKYLKLSIVNGTEDLDASLQLGVEKFIQLLKDRSFPENNLLFWISNGQSHTESAWSNQSKRILKWMFNKKSNPTF
jgi:enterochelin esterase-like enzyme